MKHTIIDTHAHLDHIENVELALEEASRSGVVGVISVGVDLKANRRNLELKQRTVAPKIFVALGIHPGNINPAEVDETIRFIRENIREAVAIGEAGLDYWYKWVRKDEEKKKEQRDVFQKQIVLSKEFDLPIIIHSRGAWRDCLNMVKDAGVRKALFHWYSGPVDILTEILAEGYYVSASPSLAFSPQSREAIVHVPLDRLLIETDSPVFYQFAEKGFQATPKDVFRTLTAYCELKGGEEPAILSQLNRNAGEFFGIQSILSD